MSFTVNAISASMETLYNSRGGMLSTNNGPTTFLNLTKLYHSAIRSTSKLC